MPLFYKRFSTCILNIYTYPTVMMGSKVNEGTSAGEGVKNNGTLTDK
jgi:hypothetical protein